MQLMCMKHITEKAVQMAKLYTVKRSLGGKI